MGGRMTNSVLPIVCNSPIKLFPVIDVKEGLVVRAREQFTVPSEAAMRTDADELADILAQPFAQTELVLNVATYHVRNTASLDPELVISAEISSEIASPSAVSLAALLVEGDDGDTRTTLAQVRRPENDRSNQPLRYITSMTVEPGDYAVKIAAIDDSGRRGSVEHRGRFEPHRSGALELSDLLLVDLSMAPVSPPITAGLSSGNALGGYLEIYASRESLAGANAWFEVASTAAAESLVRVPVEVQESETEGRWLARAPIPLQSLASGSYTARAVLSGAHGASASVMREFELVSSEPPAKDVADIDVGSAELFSRGLVGPPRRLQWSLVEGDVKAVVGSYLFEDAGAGRTRITCTQAVDVGFWIPGFLRRVFEQHALKESVEELKTAVEARSES